MDEINNPFLQTIRIPVEQSKILIIYLILLHFFSLFLPWFSALSFIEKIIFTSIPCFSAGYFLYKFNFSVKDRRVSELILNADDEWQVKLNNGNCYSAILAPSQFVHPYLSIITLRYNKTRQNFIFTIDNIDKDVFRRLRVRLRFKAS